MSLFVSAWRHLVRGFTRLASDAQSDRDINDELHHFLEQATQDGVARGLTTDAARREARLKIGNATFVREGVRASFWESSVTAFTSDVRYALRMLRRTPAFTIVIVLVISLGTGAVTTIFSAANALLLKPIPGVVNPDQLVQIDRISKDGNDGTQASYPLHAALRDNNHTLQAIAAWSRADLTISLPGGGVAAYGNIVSGNYFSTLGVQPALGRFFLPDEDAAPLAHPVIVVSFDFWKSHLGSDSSAIGRTVGVNGHQYTVIGVTPPEFHGVFGPIITSAWVPLAMQPWVRANRELSRTTNAWLWQFARIKPNVTPAAVQQEIAGITRAYSAEREPERLRKYSEIRLITLTGLPDDAHKALLAFLAVLLGAAVLVLIIACVNVAAMLSARAVARQREMALRVALGAQRSRIVRQLLTESIVLFALGAVGGMLVASVCTTLAERISLPIDVPMALEVSPDVRVFAFALAVSLFTGVVFGLSPALRVARQDINSRLRDDAQGSGRRRSIVSNGLVVGQMALSLVLLVSAGLLLRALDRGRSISPGFEMQGVVTAPMTMSAWGYDEDKSRNFAQRLRDRVAAIPGVTHVSYAGKLPLAGSTSGFAINTGSLGDSAAARRIDNVRYADVAPGFLDAMQIPLLRGRAFSDNDSKVAPHVAIISETLAKVWPDGDALGKTFVMSDSEVVTVIGVARDAKYSSLSELPAPFMYLPLAQHWETTQFLVTRFTGAEAATRRAIQIAVGELDPALPVPAIHTMEQATIVSLLPQRVAAIVAGSLGLVGLLLATVGLYGIISYSASRRTREIGIRMALGARQGDVQRIVVVEGMRLAAWGVAIGVGLAAGASRLLTAYLFGVNPLDGVTFIAMPALFLVVTLIASYMPARKASRANPVVALRSA